jgi:putative ABC transport system permease protein
VTWPRALLAVPAALLVALVAGAVPAGLAARAQPLDAVNPVVRTPRRTRPARGVVGLGLANAVRTQARTLVAAAGLFIAVCAFTLLLGITVAFRGTVVGTLLGDAVAVQVRGADYAAAAATLLLAGIGVANVLYLNLRDRGAEIATLRALGWHENHLRRLVVTEGAAIALIGAVPGAALGLLGAALLAGGIGASLIVAALISLGVGLAVAVAASAVPIWLLARMPTAMLLTEE